MTKPLPIPSWGKISESGCVHENNNKEEITIGRSSHTVYANFANHSKTPAAAEFLGGQDGSRQRSVTAGKGGGGS